MIKSYFNKMAGLAIIIMLFSSCRFFSESSEYFGVDINTKRNVFVIDISGSMEGKVEKGLDGKIIAEATNKVAGEVGSKIGGRVGGMLSRTARSEMTKLAEVKNNLIPVIRGLPEDSYFNIITFENKVSLWKNVLVQATQSNKNMAIIMLERLESGGGTNLYGGLEEAFKMAGPGAKNPEVNLDVEMIFFLTDGQPSAGKITNPTKILESVQGLNTANRVIVNAVGLGKDKDADFLRELAEQNGGVYVDK